MNAAPMLFHPSGCRLFVATCEEDEPLEVGQIQSFGGTPRGNTLVVICNPDDLDAGQGLVRNAVGAPQSMQFRMIFNDGAANHAPSVRHFAGVVRSASTVLDDVKWKMTLTAEIELVGQIVKDAAEAHQE